jgi:quinol monooxygenase YgiN
MTDPIVFIIRNRIKPGRVDDFRAHYRDSVPPIEAGKPGTLVQLAYESQDAAEVAIVRVFPSAEALDRQLQGAPERSKRTYEFIEPVSIEIYGTPSHSAVEKMKTIAGSGVAVSIDPRFIGGFIRPKSE